MTWDQAIALFSANVSFVGLIFVGLQLRDSARQQQSQSLVKIYDINRELLSLGFSHPQLFEILNDAKHVNPEWERRYLQLWLNQLSLVHLFMQRAVVDKDLKESLAGNLRDFMTLENMRRQWRERGKFYPASFQKLVNDILKADEPPAKAVHRAGTANGDQDART